MFNHAVWVCFIFGIQGEHNKETNNSALTFYAGEKH